MMTDTVVCSDLGLALTFFITKIKPQFIPFSDDIYISYINLKKGLEFPLCLSAGVSFHYTLTDVSYHTFQ